MKELLEELFVLIEEDAEALQCTDEVYSTRKIVEQGTSADRQRAVYNEALAGGPDEHAALCKVVQSLITEFSADL